MRKIEAAIATVAVVSLIFPNASLGQNHRMHGSGGWGAGHHYSRMYNRGTVESLNGEVISVNKITPSQGMSHGIHLILKTGKETIPVHLGPGWYIENQDIQIQPKDKIQITGSRINFAGKPAIIAAEIKKGNDILKLRDEKGFPAWSGWRYFNR